jgi:hypothetical protein
MARRSGEIFLFYVTKMQDLSLAVEMTNRRPQCVFTHSAVRDDKRRICPFPYGFWSCVGASIQIHHRLEGNYVSNYPIH